MKQSISPVEVTIESLGGLGDGIGRYQNKPIFIAKSCAGDRLLVDIIHQNHDGYHGAIREILAPGPARASAPCPHFSDCGGCRLQQLSDSDYRQFKTRMLQSALHHAGYGETKSEVLFIGHHARRRVEFKLTKERTIGFHALRTNHAHAIENCLVLEPAIAALIAPLNALLANVPFAERISAIHITAADSGLDMMLSLKAEQFPDSTALTDWSDKLGVARLALSLTGGKQKILREESPVTMRLGSYDIAITPDVFLQATRAGQQQLTDAVLAATNNSKNIVDLFSGIGTYSFPLSAKANVHAVELDVAMIRSLQENAKRHRLSHLTAESRDLFKKPLMSAELNRFDAAIINPPRAGAKAQTEQLAASSVPLVVMVSCNPATFARDAKTLKNAGFKLESAQGIDQFVYSQHLELVAIFKR